jgi:hypothetical protein
MRFTFLGNLPSRTPWYRNSRPFRKCKSLVELTRQHPCNFPEVAKTNPLRINCPRAQDVSAWSKTTRLYHLSYELHRTPLGTARTSLLARTLSSHPLFVTYRIFSELESTLLSLAITHFSSSFYANASAFSAAVCPTLGPFTANFPTSSWSASSTIFRS